MNALSALTIAVLIGACACARDQAPTSPSGVTPTIASLSPSTGRPGTEVTIRGSSFAASGNHVRFGDGYIRDLPSSDGTTLRFVVPEGLDLCAPNSSGPCPGGYPAVRPGDYRVAVMAHEGESNAATFTVTAP